MANSSGENATTNNTTTNNTTSVPAAVEEKPKTVWTEDMDRKLLLFSMGNEIASEHYKKISNAFDEKPTPQEIYERLLEHRRRQTAAIDASNGRLEHPHTTIHPPVQDEEEKDGEDAAENGEEGA
ncbi:uncharacterized protein LTR77_010694 [Saxophila tyrrhenica]|uniref:Uncharacterized protein n=1 Tax=Saxophila tyrrhenica TaxID=1690608 RepID=A0AAV9NXW0_9PEZI|nr:hypothetical protein LTR77_010694 [Saxophila tyrrhenica]